MAVDEDTVTQIARLARIRIEPSQRAALVGELNNILGWVEQLSEIDTKGVPPMTSVVETRLELREDRVTDGGDAEAITANAPERVGGFFVVPKVVE